MKRLVILSASVLLLLSGCGGPGQQFAGTMIGAHVGGVLGRAAFGGHSYGGAVFGDVVGTLAGAAVGAAVTAPRQEVVVVEDDDPGRYQRPSDSRYDATTKQRRPSYRLEPVKTEESKALADLKVKNLRFVDQNRNRIINSNERCQLLFDVVNDGEVAMHDVTPYI